MAERHRVIVQEVAKELNLPTKQVELSITLLAKQLKEFLQEDKPECIFKDTIDQKEDVFYIRGLGTFNHARFRFNKRLVAHINRKYRKELGIYKIKE